MRNNESDATLRALLVAAMRDGQSHINFDSAVGDFPMDLRGSKAAGAPHSAWQLLEHMRIAQRDILEFSRDPNYKSPKWPEGYWPPIAIPPSTAAWDESIDAFRKDAQGLSDLIQDVQQDLFKPFEHGDGQTLLREALLVATHNSYHLGQFVFLKKMLAGGHER
ncbi:MAG: DinB family protein [Bryobacteraceae bacterium]